MDELLTDTFNAPNYNAAIADFGIPVKPGSDTKYVEITHSFKQPESKMDTLCVSILDLNDIKYGLKHSLSVFIYKEGTDYYAESADFDVYGVGEDEKDALLDLKSNLITYYESLKEDPNVLSYKLKAKLRTLEGIVNEYDRE